MIAKKGQPAEPENQSNYEAAVLDFLDKEMAGVQSTITEKEQAQELDALVADLMHQVLAESDQQPSSGEMMVSQEDMNDLLAEFTPQPATVSPPDSNSAPMVPELESESIQVDSISADEYFFVPAAVESPIAESPLEPTPETWAMPAPAAAMFASASARKNRMPMIAAAVVCTLAAMGIPMYYFSGSSGKTPTHESAQVATPAAVEPGAAGKTAKASAQPKLKLKASRVVPPAAGKKSASADSRAPAPVGATQKPTVSQVMKPLAAPAANTSNPAPAQEERPAETQIAQSQSPAVPRAIPETVAEAHIVQSQPIVVPRTILERRAPTIIAENPVPASAASALPAPPIAARALVPAVAISQVSPKYPEFALRTRTSAAVVLDVDIDKQGKVIKATPVSGPPMFHKEAINAAMQWRYRPASIGGSNVSSQVKVTFNFNLK